MALDGQKIGPVTDLYSGRVQPTGPLDLGPVTLGARLHHLRVTVTGKSKEPSGYRFGLDAVDLATIK